MNTDKKLLRNGVRPCAGRARCPYRAASDGALGERALPGFTLVELLVVIAILAVLAALLLPVLAGTKQSSQAAACLENHRRLMTAWRMYAEDNSGILPPNDYPYTTSYLTQPITQRPKFKCWACGTMESAIDSKAGVNPVNPYNMLTDPVGMALAAYIRDPKVYQCAADAFINPFNHSVHCRSYSMNAAVGTQWYGSVCGLGGVPCGTPMTGGWLPGNAYNASQTTWLTYGKISSFTRPGPANTLVLIDESPITINDSSFAVSAFAAPGATYLIDFPSGSHNGAAVLSFADGHAITRRWQDPRTCTPPTSFLGLGGTGGTGKQTPDDPDCFYFASITSARR